MRKKNCWEEKNCGRFPGGSGVGARGPCPAATCIVATGINGGLYAGRACWAIDNSSCAGQGKGESLQKKDHCRQCYFYSLVRAEEGDAFKDIPEISGELAGYQRY